jgi:hypothetical protein
VRGCCGGPAAGHRATCPAPSTTRRSASTTLPAAPSPQPHPPSSPPTRPLAPPAGQRQDHAA